MPADRAGGAGPPGGQTGGAGSPGGQTGGAGPPAEAAKAGPPAEAAKAGPAGPPAKAGPPAATHGVRAGLLLTPGAGAGRDQPTLVALDEALTADGVAVERMDFPYRRAGRKAPDRPPVLIAAVREGAAALADRTGLPPERIAVGGRSMGGRMCSLAVADGMPAAGLVLISYPLHPPGKPDRLRVEHFPALTVPCLFVSGTRDAFGTPEELTAAVSAIPGPVEHVWLEGGDHGLRRRDGDVVHIVRAWVRHRLC